MCCVYISESDSRADRGSGLMGEQGEEISERGNGLDWGDWGGISVGRHGLERGENRVAGGERGMLMCSFGLFAATRLRRVCL